MVQKFGNASIRLFVFLIRILSHEKDAPNLDSRPRQLPIPQNLPGLQIAHKNLEPISVLPLPQKIGLHPLLENESASHACHFLGQSSHSTHRCFVPLPKKFTHSNHFASHQIPSLPRIGRRIGKILRELFGQIREVPRG